MIFKQLSQMIYLENDADIGLFLIYKKIKQAISGQDDHHLKILQFFYCLLKSYIL